MRHSARRSTRGIHGILHCPFNSRVPLFANSMLPIILVTNRIQLVRVNRDLMGKCDSVGDQNRSIKFVNGAPLKQTVLDSWHRHLATALLPVGNCSSCFLGHYTPTIMPVALSQCWLIQILIFFIFLPSLLYLLLSVSSLPSSNLLPSFLLCFHPGDTRG